MSQELRELRNSLPASSWYDIASLMPSDMNQNDIPDKSRSVSNEKSQQNDYNGNYFTNFDYSVWMRSCEHEVIKPLAGKLTGSIPKWLKGTLLRNGPGNLKVGQYNFQHLFDSSALVHKYEISDGKVTYQRRFVQTEVYKKNMAAQRIVVTEFGTKAIPDPCQSIFHRVASIFDLQNTTDNTMISVYPFGDEYYTLTETPVMHRIDPKTLETTGKIDVSKHVNIVNHTAHPHIMADGTVYNVGLNVTPLGLRYSVVRFSPSLLTVDETGEERELSMFDQATIVASVPCRWMLNPSYMHTFGITENYFIIVEQPLAISVVSMMIITQLKQDALLNSFKWQENESTLIHVVSRETGQTVRTFISDMFFFFHIINQFETRDKEYIVLDICCYRDPSMLEGLYIDSMKNMHKNPDYANLFRSRPLRFVLPMKQPCANTPPDYNLVTIETVHQGEELFRDVDDKLLDYDSDEIDFEIVRDMDVVITNINNVESKWDEHKKVMQRKPAAYLLSDSSIYVKPELICNLGCETPRVNPDYVGREYRYFYAMSSDMDLNNPAKLIKVDTYRKTRKIWQEKGVFPSEPVFVADPNGKNEDDGIIVSSLVWGEENESQVGLLILDAATWTEIARAIFDAPGPAPRCLHGWFNLDKQ